MSNEQRVMSNQAASAVFSDSERCGPDFFVIFMAHWITDHHSPENLPLA